MVYEERKGDIFKLDSDYVLVQPISRAYERPEIYLPFDDVFPALRVYTLNKIDRNLLSVPSAVRYPGIDSPFSVISILLSDLGFSDLQASVLSKGFEFLKEICDSYRIHNISMYSIKFQTLSWDVVRTCLQGVFKDTSLKILIINNQEV